MLKVSFKEGYKRVQTFNDRATVVTIVSHLAMPSKLWSTFPDSIANWMWYHSTVDASWGKCTENTEVIRLEVSCKSVCAEEDTFNAVIGERIAETRAMIKLYLFMYNLIKKLCDYYSELLLGYTNFRPASNDKGSLYTELYKYEGLAVKASVHLSKLLEEA